VLDLEELGEDELDRLRAVYEDLARQAREQLRRGVLDTDTPEVQATSLQDLAREVRGGRRAASLVLFDQAGQPIWSTALAAQQREGRS
jgi:ornithine cyclodeaminase/alanine dehydrogenase-like protein (mu-crystallin family)